MRLAFVIAVATALVMAELLPPNAPCLAAISALAMAVAVLADTPEEVKVLSKLALHDAHTVVH